MPRATKKKKAKTNTRAADIDILTDAKSQLAHVDLVQFFADPATWAHFDEDDKAVIRTLIPQHVPVDTEGLPTKDYLKYDTDFRQSVRLFQTDLAAGRFDPEWQRQAAQAMEERANGQFDEWKSQNFEQFWGQKAEPEIRTKPDMRVGKKDEGPGTESIRIRLHHMFRGGVFQVGDVWSCAWLFEDKVIGNTLIEKELEIVSIDSKKGFGTFAIASGAAKIVNDQNRVRYEAKTLTDLEGKILEVDKRVAQGKRRKSWKDFQCHRNGMDLGSIWDMREVFNASQ